MTKNGFPSFARPVACYIRALCKSTVFRFKAILIILQISEIICFYPEAKLSALVLAIKLLIPPISYFILLSLSPGGVGGVFCAVRPPSSFSAGPMGLWLMKLIIQCHAIE
jgi:hypothetical protein